MTLPNPIKYHLYTGQDLPEPWPYDYVISRFGVVKRASTPAVEVEFDICPSAFPIRGLADYPAERIALRVPRIPARWLSVVLEDAQKAGGSGQVLTPVEQMYHFHYLDDAWRVARPRQQQASGGQVRYRGGSEASVALDLHSHHQMAAYFSDTDNRDEQGCRFYAVIGRIYDRPELRLRLGVYGDFVELDPLVLFDGLGPFREAE